MTVIKEPRKWYIKLFTLGKKFSSKTFSDNTKKFLLNAVGLFVVVNFTFYVENLGDEYETKHKYIKLVKDIRSGMNDILVYSDGYKEKIDFVAERYNKQLDKWEVDNDSIFIDFIVDEEEPDGKYYSAPMNWFKEYDPFNPPIISGSFGIFESGNQDFKLVDPFTTKIIAEIMKGTDLKYLKENTNEIERKMIQEYEEILKEWSRDIDVTEYYQNDFWIKNRKFIQNDGQLKYLLHRRKELWEFNIKYHIEDYSQKVKDDQKILDSMINIFDEEKYFLYWKIN